MKIIVEQKLTTPKYKKTAAELLTRCREFYRDPENERAFQEWMKNRKKTEGK